MEDDLSCLLDRADFGRSRASVDLLKRKHRLGSASACRRNGLHEAVIDFLVEAGVGGVRCLEGAGVRAGLRLSEDWVHRLWKGRRGWLFCGRVLFRVGGFLRMMR